MKTYFEPIVQIYELQEEDIVRTSLFETSFGATDYEDVFDDDWE